MPLRPTALALVRLGVALLVLAAGAGAWEVLATQIPTSPAWAGVLPGPVGMLRSTAFLLGLAMFPAAWLLPRMAPDHEPRIWFAGVVGGAALTLGSMIYGASKSVFGLQVLDPRPSAMVLFAVRMLGLVLLGVALLVAAVRLWRNPTPRNPGRSPGA